MASEEIPTNEENKIDNEEIDTAEAAEQVPVADSEEAAGSPEAMEQEEPASEDVEAESGESNEDSDSEVDLDKLKRIVEGALFAAAKPMTIDHLGALFLEDERPSKDNFRTVLNRLVEEYAERGVMLKEVSSGFRFQVKEDVGQWVSRLWEEKPARYSRALLETLALIAYRQPITRGEIEEIRGVSTSSHIMKTLQERDWIRVVGHRDVPGRPAMYATTRIFLDYFNLKNIDELPSLAEIRDLDEINRELDLKSDNDVAEVLAENAEKPEDPDVEGETETAEKATEVEEPTAETAADSASEETTAPQESPLEESQTDETT